MLIPLSHWAHGRGAAHKLHIAALCGGLSRIPTDSLSLGGWTELGCLCFDKLSIPIVTRSPQLVESPADGVAGRERESVGIRLRPPHNAAICSLCAAPLPWAQWLSGMSI